MSTTQANPDQDEFDAAFAEATGDKPATETPQPEGSDADADVKVDPPAPEKEPQAAAPAPEAAPKDVPQEPSKEAPAPTAEDRLKELERQIQEASYRERQSAGRASQTAKLNSQLQQKLEETHRRLAELEAAQAARQKTADVKAPENDALAEAPDLRHSVQHLIQQQMSPVLEELAATKARLQEVEPLATRAAEIAQPLAEHNLQQTIAATQAEMDRDFPGWRQERTTNQFQNWLGAQPKPIQDLYENGVSPDECRAVLSLYSAQTGRLRTQPATPAPAATTAPTATAQERLRASAGISPRVPKQIPAPDPDDFDAAWAEATKGK